MRFAKTLAMATGLSLASAAALLSTRAGNIENFVRVDDGVSAGAKLNADQVATLYAQGTRTIVDLREPGEIPEPSPAAAAEQAGIRYISLPVKTAEPRDEQVHTFLSILSDSKTFPVFLTCGSGNRVGAFWMIRRMVVDGWTPENAEKEARRIGLKSPHLLEFALSFANRHRGEKDWPVICGFGSRAPSGTLFGAAAGPKTEPRARGSRRAES